MSGGGANIMVLIDYENDITLTDREIKLKAHIMDAWREELAEANKEPEKRVVKRKGFKFISAKTAEKEKATK